MVIEIKYFPGWHGYTMHGRVTRERGEVVLETIHELWDGIDLLRTKEKLHTVKVYKGEKLRAIETICSAGTAGHCECYRKR